MNRNTEYRIDKLPQINVKRSLFKYSDEWKGTFNASYLIPFFVSQDIYPSETYRFKHTFVLRMLTPIYPVIDVCYIDTYFVAVPFRLIWGNFKKFMGENENGVWAQTVEYETPQLNFGSSGNSTCAKGTVANYMGIPIGTKDTTISALPFRAYVKAYNDLFRDQNFIPPATMVTSDTTIAYSAVAGPINGGIPFKVAKRGDYFTTCLPQPEKGTAPTIPLGTKAEIKYGKGIGTGTTDTLILDYQVQAKTDANNNAVFEGAYVQPGPITTVRNQDTNTVNTLYADLATATAATLDALRTNIAVKHILEANARYGSRYTEIVRSLFGCSTPDARQQRAEYLGGRRYQINMNQVVQTSETSGTSPMGNTSAFSLTVAKEDIVFTKSFTEHTVILGLLAIRQLQSYQQGIHRQWKRKKKFDYFFPQLINLSEQPVYNHEIYCQGDNVVDASGEIIDNQVFGYQERFGELKRGKTTICGELSSLYSAPLDSWHYGSNFISLPGLNQQFIEETDTYIQRTLAVQNHDQFIMDSNIDIEAIKPMPIYNVPGLDKI